MNFLSRIIKYLPISGFSKLAWQRTQIERAYAMEIAAAKKIKDKVKIASLEDERRFELQLNDEENDSLFTRKLLVKARRLRVPIPNRYKVKNSESEHWYVGQQTGDWCLTESGIAVLRDEIRREIKAKHEGRAHWVVWISALTGVIGAVTGLVALLGYKAS